MDDELERLTELFRKLGADDPESWAYSQVNEGIPQLACFLFLRQAWRQIVSTDSHDWMAAYVDAFDEDPTGPYGGAGWALKKLQDKDATPEELSHLVRAMQAELLFGFCYLLEDPGGVEEDVSHVRWGLFLLDEDYQPVRRISGLHESVLETDPTGNEAGLGTVPD